MSQDKRAAAKVLYFEGTSQKAISSILNTAEPTLSRWKKEDRWAEELEERNNIEATNELYAKKAMNYQLKTINRMIEDYEKNEKQGVYSLIGKGEIDALSKLYATIKKKDVEWITYVKIVKELMKYIEQADLELAKQIIELSNQFLNDIRNNL